jgi:hypothetical protein
MLYLSSDARLPSRIIALGTTSKRYPYMTSKEFDGKVEVVDGKEAGVISSYSLRVVCPGDDL